MFHVFEALDELVAMIEEARGLPMSSQCMVPRSDALLLLDEIRDALPGELDDAQDVLATIRAHHVRLGRVDLPHFVGVGDRRVHSAQCR